MDHMYRPELPDGACLEDDVFLVPFDVDGRPSAVGHFWDLRVGKRVRLTGGPYAGDVGRVVEKSAAGDYRLRFEDSVHPQFGVKRRPFSLWLGRWWVAEATRGFGIVPGGRVPLVSVPDDAA